MIDTHCHIDDPQFAADLDAVVARQQQEGVEAILVPGVNMDSLDSITAVCQRYPGYLYPAFGLHPEDVNASFREALNAIYARVKEAMSWSLPERSPLVAIGEIGLDYHFSEEFKTEQQEALRIQLRWAKELNLPVMIHARDAAEDTLRIIREEMTLRPGEHELRGVMHCYSGSREIALEYVKMGWKLGIGGVLTFKNCKLPDTLRAIPLSALVLETDAPYMAPVPYRGKPNESRWMKYVAAKLAEVYETSENEVISVTNASAKALFQLK